MKTLLAALLLVAIVSVRGAEPMDAAGTPAAASALWNGFKRVDFVVAGRPCVLVQPAKAAPGAPWIWRTEFFGTEPQVDVALLGLGWHVAYMDAKDMYGAPPAMALFGSFYAHVVTQYGLATRVVLEGFSRGGLYAFNFAVAHPSRVAGLYLDAAVLDIRSWPGRNRQSKEWRECLAIYGLNEETVGGFKGNPVDRIDPVARAGIPIIAVCGAADQTVVVAQNTAVLERRYRELGAPIEVIMKPGVDHHPHSLKDPAPIVDFIVNHVRL